MPTPDPLENLVRRAVSCTAPNVSGECGELASAEVGKGVCDFVHRDQNGTNLASLNNDIIKLITYGMIRDLYGLTTFQ